ncbi:branched-chain-amino-acid aminotransferase-like protein 2 [Acanthaster planci]|uniref:Branched-chain-amino-acid aminotransferase-like protein 2 n=1 Tax=Acanthaster planci TaxID=133434 RepID=A0A8B7YNP5_ACAPL|nr:branched-chain-amino-acid aminotransferase-like protein 2 [Acanthaster planci]
MYDNNSVMASQLGVNKVFLWSTPRCVSTAFAKCMSFVDAIQIVHEPYLCAFLLDVARDKPQNPTEQEKMIDDRTYEVLDPSVDAGESFDEKTCTFSWIKDELLSEKHYPDKKIIFCKDVAHHLAGKYDMLPEGFKYSFAIRHPAKVYMSLKILLTRFYGGEIDLLKLPLFPSGFGYKELSDLVDYVRLNLDPTPTIVDTDDLLADPSGILPVYCEKTGIPYSDTLLSWPAGSDIVKQWKIAKYLVKGDKLLGFYKAAFESTEFLKPEPPPVIDTLPEDVQKCVKATLGYYDKLRKDRISALPRK